MRWILLIAGVLAAAPVLCQQKAQDEVVTSNNRKMKVMDSAGWNSTGNFLLSINESTQSAWPSGGESFLIGINAMFNYAIHHQKGKLAFDSYVDLELGFVEATSFKAFRKTMDRCDLTAEIEHHLKGHWNYGLLFNFNSQLFAGYNYKSAAHEKISGFLSPGKFLAAPGVNWKQRTPEHFVEVFISPATVKWVTKKAAEFFNTSKFGVDSAHVFHTELGAYLTTHVNLRMGKWTSYIGRVDFFSSYGRNIRHLDVLLNNLFTIGISRLFSATILFDLVYDDDINRAAQILHTLGVGLRLKL
jgi:hypothetical protein